MSRRIRFHIVESEIFTLRTVRQLTLKSQSLELVVAQSVQK
mgnify:CR=1 FL=1